MCDQTEVTYSPGDVVWVKLGPVWWPGQVQDYDKLPEEITHDLRKRPIAVVKFFQEDSYEYVKNLNQIYHYNCRKKEEFIKKGLDVENLVKAHYGEWSEIKSLKLYKKILDENQLMPEVPDCVYDSDCECKDEANVEDVEVFETILE